MDDLQAATSLDEFYRVEDPWHYENSADDRRRVEMMLAALPQTTFTKVLDIGCGNGFLTRCLPGKKVIGVDISKKAVEWATRRSQAPNCEYCVGSVFDLGRLFSECFDLIVVTGVLYTQYVGQAFTFAQQQIDTVLCPGGYLAHAHIDEWFSHSFPYSAIERQLYPYLSYHHRLEVYRK